MWIDGPALCRELIKESLNGLLTSLKAPGGGDTLGCPSTSGTSPAMLIFYTLYRGFESVGRHEGYREMRGFVKGRFIISRYEYTGSEQ